MGSILIRKVDDALKTQLRIRAAENGHSMEEEARAILRRELEQPAGSVNLADLAREIFGPKGIDLEPHPPVPVREPPDFSD